MKKINNKKTWIIGVSGGVDSMVLLDKMKNIYNCIVAHVIYNKKNKNLKKNIVFNFCKKNKIIFEKKIYNIKKICNNSSFYKINNNFQNNARIFRFIFFKKLIKKYNAKGVMLGHHKDDDLETFIFKKYRKSFGDDIGISKNSKIFGIKVYRPLLEYKKKNLYDYSKKKKIIFLEDKSNNDIKFKRNKIRFFLKKMNFKKKKKLFLKLYNYKKKKKNINNNVYNNILKWKNIINLRDYLKITKKFGVIVLRLWFKKNNIFIKNKSLFFFNNLHKNIIKNKFFKKINKNIYLCSSYNKIFLGKIKKFFYIFEKIKYKKYSNFIIKKKGKKNESITIKKKDLPLIFRTPVLGDKIKMKFGHKKINRFFIDKKIPLFMRKNWLIIENVLKKIIFVSELGPDIDHFSKKPNFYVESFM